VYKRQWYYIMLAALTYESSPWGGLPSANEVASNLGQRTCTCHIPTQVTSVCERATARPLRPPCGNRNPQGRCYHECRWFM